MMGRWEDPEIAKDGWEWIRCDDSNHYPGPEKCQMCGTKHPRYLHRVEHSVHGRWTVGRVCAAWMTADDPRVEAGERALKLATRRKKDAERRAQQKQIAQAWKKSGASWRASCQGGKVTVFSNDGGYQIRWARSGHSVTFDDETYSSVEAAKKATRRAMVKMDFERVEEAAA